MKTGQERAEGADLGHDPGAGAAAVPGVDAGPGVAVEAGLDPGAGVEVQRASLGASPGLRAGLSLGPSLGGLDLRASLSPDRDLSLNLNPNPEASPDHLHLATMWKITKIMITQKWMIKMSKGFSCVLWKM